jgi:hypothetical protein
MKTLLIIILLILILYILNKEDFEYFLNVLLYNPVIKKIDITNNSFKKKLKILILSTDNRNTEYIQRTVGLVSRVFAIRYLTYSGFYSKQNTEWRESSYFFIYQQSMFHRHVA